MSGRSVVAGMCLVALALSVSGAGAARKKVIATGWDNPTPQQLRRDLKEMEQRPFDGVTVEVTAEGAPEAVGGRPLRLGFSTAPWERRWFEQSVADLKATRPTRLTDNFAVFGANPGGVDWFDDAGWKAIIDHWRIAAWIAKEGGLKGILFDPERYTEPFTKNSQFMYAAQAQREQHSFDAYYEKARQRGAEVMRAITAEYPDITVFAYFLNSYALGSANAPDPRAELAGDAYGLLPAFVDGWLDAANPQVKIIDGHESSYTYNSDLQFYQAAVQMKLDAQSLVSPENRAKYRAQVQGGFGLYLDAYRNPITSPYYIDGLGGPRVARLQANLTTALRAADEYVWVYGEQGRWWPEPAPGQARYGTWPEVLPGSEAAIATARDPFEAVQTQLEELRRSGRNLARNGDFSSEQAATNEGASSDWKEGQAPAGWMTWQDDNSHGAFTWDRTVGGGSARLAGVQQGCFIQTYRVQPGQRYVIAAKARVGSGAPAVRVRWKTPEGRWTSEDIDVRLWHGEPDRRGWEQFAGTVTVPPPAGEIVLLLGASGQVKPDQAVWFDDVEVYAD